MLKRDRNCPGSHLQALRNSIWFCISSADLAATRRRSRRLACAIMSQPVFEIAMPIGGLQILLALKRIALIEAGSGVERETVGLAVGGAGGLVEADANAVEQVLIIEEEALESARDQDAEGGHRQVRFEIGRA